MRVSVYCLIETECETVFTVSHFGDYFCGSFMGFFLSCVCYVFVHVCLYVLCDHLLGKG